MPLKRKLFRLSALFELADDEFVSLRDKSGIVTKQIHALVSSGDRHLLLDYASLSKFIDTSPAVAELCAAAAEVGFDFEELDDPFYEGNNEKDYVSDLIQLATIAGIPTLEQFELKLELALPWAKKYLEAQYHADEPTKKSVWHVTPPFICELIFICAAVEYLRLGHLLRLGFNRGIGTRVFSVATEFDKRKA